MILGENDLEAVLEFVLFEFQLWHFEWRGFSGGRLCGRLCRHFGGRFCRGRRRRLRLRGRRTCAGQQSEQAKRQCILTKKPHNGILSKWRNITIRQRTKGADVLKSPAVSLPCFSMSASTLRSNHREEPDAVRTTSVKTRILSRL